MKIKSISAEHLKPTKDQELNISSNESVVEFLVLAKEEIERLTKKNQELNKLYESTSINIEKLEAKLSAQRKLSEDQINYLSSELDFKSEASDSLLNENKNLQVQLKQLNLLNSHLTSIENELKNNENELQNKIQQLTSEMTKIKELYSTALVKLKAEIEQLSQEKKLSQKSNEIAIQELNELAEENKQLLKIIDSLQEIIEQSNELKNENEQLKSTNESLSKENRDIKDELELTSKKERQSLVSNQEHSELKKKLASFSIENENLKNQLYLKTIKYEKINLKNEAINNAKIKLIKNESDIQSLNNTLDDLSSKEKALETKKISSFKNFIFKILTLGFYDKNKKIDLQMNEITEIKDLITDKINKISIESQIENKNIMELKQEIEHLKKDGFEINTKIKSNCLPEIKLGDFSSLFSFNAVS